MPVLLLGDSHLARIRGARLASLSSLVGEQVVNAAVGGASCRELAGQLALAPAYDVVAVSVGTNDGAPWKSVPLEEFAQVLRSFVPRLVGRLVYVTSPGVDEARLVFRAADRTNEGLVHYSAAAAGAFRDAGGSVLDVPALIAALGPEAYVDDGVHLSGPAYDLLVPALATALRAA